ncbi:MAG: hypothetical protein IPQ23_02505 [Cytophagaceae bacterium]|nr:hypothetical protein [Cytophagaceae bacterium]
MNPFENLKEIIFGSQRPWLPENNSENKFESLFLDLPGITSDQTRNFSIEFFRPINFKTKYYSKAISNEVERILNLLIPEIKNESDLKVQKYLHNILLVKQLQTLLKDIGKIIKEKQYEITYLDSTKTTFDIDTNHKADTFIIHFLKLNCIMLYLEIQNVFCFAIKDEFIEEDFYTRLLFEKLPERTFIKNETTLYLEPILYEEDSLDFEIPILEEPIENTFIIEQKKETPSIFNPIEGEVPGTRPSKLTYQFIKSVEKFKEVETLLYDYKIIDLDCNFIKNKATSNNRLLASVIRKLIDLGYFRKNTVGYKGLIKETHIREYFENRYHADISQEFRKLNQDHLEFASRKLPWLDKLQALR